MSLGIMKALKQLGYANAWMAWIPLANYYALADVAANKEENINLIGTLTIPVMLYKLWWLVMLVASFVPIIGSIVAIAIQVICLGHIFTRLFARIDHTQEQQQQTLAYISGLIPLVAAIKFLSIK
jgi:hypothetical protein